VRAPALLLLSSLLAGPLQAQASVASDLWKIANGTLVVPDALADDGMAPFWTPAVVLTGTDQYRIGIEAIHAPSEIGVNGGMLAFSGRARGLGTISLTYGRLSLGNVGYTETSPEILGSALDIYNQQASFGLAGRLTPSLRAGATLRYLSGQLAFATRSQFGLDFGAQYTGLRHLRFGAATHFFDPRFGRSADAASYSLGTAWTSQAVDAWGTTARFEVRYGLTLARGHDTRHLLTAGVALGPSLALDYGVAREATDVDTVWRSRLGVGISAGHFTIRIGRDGGVNGFGAAYRFGLTARFP